MIVRLWIFACALLLAACQPSKLPPQAVTNTKSVAVLVNAPSSINVVQVGITVFANDRRTIEADWPIEGMLREAIATSLAGRFAVTNVPFSDLRKDQFIGGEVGSVVRTALVKAGVSADLVVAVALVERDIDPFSGKAVPVDGCGIHHLEGLFVALPPRAYCIAQIKLIDGRSFKTLATNEIINPKSSDWYESMNVFKEVPSVRWNDALVFTPDEMARFKTALNEAIAVAVPFTLRRMKVLP